MNAIEQELVNVGTILLDTLGTAAAAKNPAYASLIQTGQAFLNNLNASVNPAQAPASATLSGNVAAAIQPATNAVSTVMSKTAPAAAKASALSVLLADVEGIGAAIAAEFGKPASTG